MGDRFFKVHRDSEQVGEAQQTEELALRFLQIDQHQVTAPPSEPALTRRECPDCRAGQHVQCPAVQDQPGVTGFHHCVGAILEPVHIGGIDPAAETEHRAAGETAAVDTVNRVKLERESFLPNVQTLGVLIGPRLKVVARHGHESIATAPESGQFREAGWPDQQAGRY